MQIEAGKYYRTRDGRKVGPMKVWPSGDGEWESLETFTDGLWKDDGSPLYSDKEYVDSPTLVAEWTEGPVRTETVTTRRIVPGVYGIVRIKNGRNGNAVDVWLNGSEATGFAHWYTADELDAAARTLQQLAEALRDDLD